MTKRLTFPILCQYLAVAILSLAMFTIAWRLWSIDLHLPFMYRADYVFSLALTKGIIQTGWVYQNPNIGAPFSGTLYDFPLPENLLHLIIRGLTLFSQDPYWVLNVFYLLGFPLTALTSLYALKSLKLPLYLALPGALAFTFLPYHFLRLEHTYLAAYFMLPLMVLLAVWVMQGQIQIFVWDIQNRRFSIAWRDPRTWGAMAICVLSGSTGVYYTFFSLFLLAIAVLRRFPVDLKARRLASSLSGVFLAGVLGLALLLNSVPYLLYPATQPPPTEVAAPRNASDTEYFGMKFIQLLLPSPLHPIGLLGRMNLYYQTLFKDTNENTFASLGMIGALGFLLSIGMFFKDSIAKDTPLKSLSLLNLSCFLFGTVGGLGSIFSYFITTQIRSVNRISVIIGFVSIAVSLLILEKLIQLTRRWLPILKPGFATALKVLVALGLAAFVYLDQCGTPISDASYQSLKTDVEQDRAFIQLIEARLPSGSIIFELPYIPFPEGNQRNGLTGYDLFKPYLASNQLRWSFGGVRGRLAGNWYRDVSSLNPRQMLDALAAANFSGIYINWKGYRGDEQSRLESDLKDFLGIEPARSADQTLSFYDLRAYSARYRAQIDQAGWDEIVYQVMNPVYRSFSVRFTGQFFVQEEKDGVKFRWSGKRSGLEIENLSTRDRILRVSFDVSTATNKPADLAIDSQLWQKTYPIDGKPRTLERELAIKAGQKLVIALACSADSYLQPNGDPRQVVFKVSNFQFSYADR